MAPAGGQGKGADFSKEERDYEDGRKKRNREGSDGNQGDRRSPTRHKKGEPSRSRGRERGDGRETK